MQFTAFTWFKFPWFTISLKENSSTITVLLQKVHWDLGRFQSRRKVITMRKPVQLNLNTGSIFLVRKLSEYLQLNHIACADLFAEVTSIFLCIILCSRYYLQFLLLLHDIKMLQNILFLQLTDSLRKEWLMCWLGFL